MAGLGHRIRAFIPYSGDDVGLAGMKPTMAVETEFCGKCVQWRRREFDKKSFAIAAPRVQLPIGDSLHGGRGARVLEGRPFLYDDALRGHLILRWSQLRRASAIRISKSNSPDDQPTRPPTPVVDHFGAFRTSSSSPKV